jgi:RNA polymerase sigma-70 factor (ECF subfamily)
LFVTGSEQVQPTDPDASSVEDARLVEAARELHEDAWAEVYARYAERVYAYIYFRVRDRHAAEDLTADVFVRAIAGVKNFEWRGTPLLAWLYRIAHNVTIDHRTRQARRSARESAVDSAQVEDGVDRIAAVGDRNDMIEAIQMLTDEQQQVLILRFYQALPTPQVAQVLDKPVTAVKALQARALRSLRRILSEGDRRRA